MVISYLLEETYKLLDHSNIAHLHGMIDNNSAFHPEIPGSIPDYCGKFLEVKTLFTTLTLRKTEEATSLHFHHLKNSIWTCHKNARRQTTEINNGTGTTRKKGRPKKTWLEGAATAMKSRFGRGYESGRRGVATAVVHQKTDRKITLSSTGIEPTTLTSRS
ncbi:hypothetical protein C0J52_10257 [Blattella germanica]|nr:hypothetical protein C0J52_10257 [Blattella germanica]